jgi:hypothetical protein
MKFLEEIKDPMDKMFSLLWFFAKILFCGYYKEKRRRGT